VLLGLCLLSLPAKTVAAKEGPGERYERYLKSVVVVKSSLGWGTGFFVTPNGLIITNQHVVGKDARVMVLLRDERVLEARVVGRAGPPLDLALLSTGRSSPAWLELAGEGEGAVGEEVIAIGTPQGLSWTVSRGIISSIRDLDELRFIQTDAAINQGNSGGPLILVGSGRVVGVNTLTMKKDLAEGIGFAVAAPEVTRAFPGFLGQGQINQARPKQTDTEVKPRPAVLLPECNVGQAQESLRELGFYSGPRDGEMGVQTAQAIKRFQAGQGLPLTGRLDKDTCFRLSKTKPSPAEPARAQAKPVSARAGRDDSGGSFRQELERLAGQRKELKEKVAAIKAKAGRGGTGAQEALDELLEVTTKMEAVDKRIKELEAKAEAELKEAAGKDAAKYKQITSSKGGRDLKEAAWLSLAARYPRYSKGLVKGDVEGFLARLEMGLGSVRVTCNVAGAVVSLGEGRYQIGIDRKVVIDPVVAGEHLLIVRKPGYVDWQGKVRVEPEGASSLSVNLVEARDPPKTSAPPASSREGAGALTGPPGLAQKDQPAASQGKQGRTGIAGDHFEGNRPEDHPGPRPAGRSTLIEIALERRREEIVRRFTTNQGQSLILRFRDQEVTGEYGRAGGRIEGRLDGSVLQGSWSRGPSQGTFIFNFNPDFTEFKGEWDSGQRHGSWTGWDGKVVEP